MFSPAHKHGLRGATIPPDCDYSPLLLRMGVSVRKTEKYVGYPGELGKPFKCSKENTIYIVYIYYTIHIYCIYTYTIYIYYIYIYASGSKCGGETSRPELSFHEVPTSSPRFSIFRHPSPGTGPHNLLAGRRSRLVETPGIPTSGLPGVSPHPSSRACEASLVQVAFRAEGQRWATPGQARAPPAARALRGPPRPRRAGASAGRRGL